MKNLFIIFLLLLVSCGKKTQQAGVTVCTCAQKEKIAELIHSSIKNANNMSNEEMEDVIIQLERTYRNTICSDVIGTYIKDGLMDYPRFDWTSVKQDSCLTYYP